MRKIKSEEDKDWMKVEIRDGKRVWDRRMEDRVGVIMVQNKILRGNILEMGQSLLDVRSGERKKIGSHKAKLHTHSHSPFLSFLATLLTRHDR